MAEPSEPSERSEPSGSPEVGGTSGDSEIPEFSEHTVAADPFTEFASWFAAARVAHGADADAVVVATADADGAPSARVVLLRGHDERGFCFFTNYDSRKGRELAANPRAALVWHWPGLGRQVRATGAVERVSAAESDAYWNGRPVGSRHSAWASRQSRPVGDRAALEAQAAAAAAAHPGPDVARPDFWGGFRLVPDTVEFWRHRDDRLHDRVQFTRTAAGTGAGAEAGAGAGAWTVVRLQP